MRALPIAIVVLALAPASAGATWTKPVGVPGGPRTFAQSVAANGHAAVGWVGESGFTIDRFHSGKAGGQKLLERPRVDASAIAVAAGPSGTIAGGWVYFDDTDPIGTDPADTFCCDRAEAATWRPGRAVRRQVLSAAGHDTDVVKVASGPGDVVVVAWIEDSGEVWTATSRRGAPFKKQLLDTIDRVGDASLQVVFDGAGRAIVTWCATGTDPIEVMTARAGATGRFGTPRSAGRLKGANINGVTVWTQASGAQTAVWRRDGGSAYVADRTALGRFGRAKVVADVDTAVALAFDAAGDGLMTWQSGSSLMAATRTGTGDFGRPVTVDRDAGVGLGSPVIFGRGRQQVLYDRDGAVFAWSGPGKTAVRLSPRGRKCFTAWALGAPDGHAFATFSCGGPALATAFDPR